MIKEFLAKNKTWFFPSAFLVMLIGIMVFFFGLSQSISVIVDGNPQKIQTSALTVSGALRAAGVEVGASDRVIPPQGQMIWNQVEIQVKTARNILVKSPDDEVSLHTAERIPANLIREAGFELYPHDRVLLNGESIDPELPLTGNDAVLLQYVPAVRLNIMIDEREQTIYTSQATLGEALEEMSILLAPQDRVSKDLLTTITGEMDVTIRRARAVTVNTVETSFTGLTAALTVGDALLDMGVPLQHLDYTRPGDDEPVPDNGEIEVVRVIEDLLIMTDEVPYENEYVEDPETILDQISVVESGQVGIYATRDRIKFANGEEIWRDSQDSWQASETEDGVIGYGTKVEIRTEVVDGQEIEYWRKISVYATAYSPCRSGVDRCLYGTATGILPVQKGVVAVTPRWISVPNGYGMWGQSVYIPGYGRGVIADTGGGIPGTTWIDLAYSDEDYQSWNRWTIMYFLTPVPPWFPAIIYP